MTAVADYPNAFMEGVDVRYGSLQRTSLSYQGIYPENWQFHTYRFRAVEMERCHLAKDVSGKYKLELYVFIDSLNLESALYADVILPEAKLCREAKLG